MIRIDIPGNLPAEIQEWKIKADEITAEILEADKLEDRHNLIDQYKNHWRKPELIKWLSGISFEKCWYTETYFGGENQEVEHFRPKKGTKNADGNTHPSHSGYYWLAFDLENYRLCKGRANRRKSTFFPILNEDCRAFSEGDAWEDETPLFLDPTKSTDTLLISFKDTGEPIPDESAFGDDITRAMFTIDKFFLDDWVLNKRRQQKWLAARNLYNSYLNALKKANSNQSIANRVKAESELQRLRDLCSPRSEFSSVAKESLMKIGDRIAAKIASQV